VSCYLSVDTPEFPPVPNYLRGQQMAFIMYEALPPIFDDVPQTRVTYIQQADLGGYIPRYFVNSQGAKRMLWISEMRKAFDKSAALEEKQSKLVGGMIKERMKKGNNATEYTKEAKAVIETGEKFFDGFRNNKRSAKVKGDAVGIASEIMDRDGLQWGKSEGVIRAKKEDVLGWMWNSDDRHRWGPSDIERRVLETKCDHHQTTYRCLKLTEEAKHGKSVPRDFVSEAVWRQQEDGSLIYVSVPTEYEGDDETINGGTQEGRHSRASFRGLKSRFRNLKPGSLGKLAVRGSPRQSSRGLGKLVAVQPVGGGEGDEGEGGGEGVLRGKSKGMAASFRATEIRLGEKDRLQAFRVKVRGEVRQAMSIKGIGNGRCKVVLVVQIGLGPNASASAVSQSLSNALGLVLCARNHFEEILPLQNYERYDGRMLGEKVMLRRSEGSSGYKRWEEIVGKLVAGHEGLKELTDEGTSASASERSESERSECKEIVHSSLTSPSASESIAMFPPPHPYLAPQFRGSPSSWLWPPRGS
jgi:hypothetical protein